MPAASENPATAAKLGYARPALIVYGSVRDLTGNLSVGSNADAMSMTMLTASDPAMKENIVRVGEHPAGFGLYLFDYKAEFRDRLGRGRKFGVMADEIEQIAPQAVVVDADGYRAVDYAQLGITLH